ncbi:ribonuclease H-like domain-containing protein [Rhizophagus clarus]|uniref:Ribonuclease H-like domain-containing protein n=1 Tax=Rhizophagus clarus TaxID=94130 RepID=A0A8H3LSQ6_9GLOM|nr:ribonuclease H-like domain-containing protein [Rhizophagus clarus]
MKRPRTHRLTKYIKVLGKQNSCNTYAACIACFEKLEGDELSRNTFTNKKLQVKNHLKNCPHFREKIGNQEELDDIINLTDNEMEEKIYQKRQKVDNEFGKNDEKVLKYLKSLQYNFKIPKFKSIEETGSVKSFRSFASSTSSTCNFNSKNTIKNNLIRTPTKSEIPKFERLLLRMSVANGFSFQWIDHPATLELFEFLNSHLILPNRKALSNRILTRETENVNTLRNDKLINDKVGVVLAFDGWKNILNQHIFGSLFILSSGEILIWDASDISSERERLIEIIPKITGLIQETKRLGIKLNAIVSDSAPAYAAAWRRLRLEYAEIVFLPCFAHQCQLAIGDIFKESPILKTASSKAIKIASYFKNANNSYFIGKLRDIQNELYDKYYSIVIPGETRWNSHYFCFKSLIRSKQALRNLAIRYERPQIDILLPYCGVLNKLQCDKARLYEVLHALGYFCQFWKQFPDSDLGNQMIDRLEKRWSQWEQPLFLLSFALHPKYQDAFKFWGYVEGDYKELAAVALKIFGMCVNAASVERMWSSIGFLHTVRHNRLKNEKILAMSQLRASINFSLREKELQQSQIQFLDSNALPMETDSEVFTPNSNIEEEEEDIEDNTIVTPEHWEQELGEWEEMLIEEGLAQLEEEEELKSNSDNNMKGDLLSEYIHPAIDKKAK